MAGIKIWDDVLRPLVSTFTGNERIPSATAVSGSGVDRAISLSSLKNWIFNSLITVGNSNKAIRINTAGDNIEAFDCIGNITNVSVNVSSGTGSVANISSSSIKIGNVVSFCCGFDYTTSGGTNVMNINLHYNLSVLANVDFDVTTDYTGTITKSKTPTQLVVVTPASVAGNYQITVNYQYKV